MRPLFALLLATAFLSPLHAQTTCGWNPDSNGDYLVTVADLLALLSVFEEADTDMDGIFDSQDDCVGSYDACGVCNGTGVDADTDGVCDDVDPCVGALDACGLCNGPGPTVPVIDEIVFMTDSVYLPPLQQWYVFSYAVDTLYTYVCPVQGCTDANAANFNPLAVIEDGSCAYGPAQCGGATTVTFDGHTYALVAIGTQCWFAENLRSDNYRNGDAIPGNLNDAQWTSTSSGAQTVYGEGSSAVYAGSSDEVANLATYGRLYNWYAVNDARGLCPSGFHVPSDGEWTVLENALGGSSVAGTALKAASPAWNGTNSSGFSALPGGYRNGHSAYFNDQGNYGYWRSSSPVGTDAWTRYLISGASDFFRDNYGYPRHGFSVRCVRDSETEACLDPDGDGVCTENEVSGCTDSTASNFNPAATESDESCEYPSPAQCGGATTVTFDGHTYGLVAIGTQCWFAENLRSDNYRNGDAIPGGLNDAQWNSTSSGAQTVYGEGSSTVYNGSSDEVANLATYGRLYNWYAVNDSRGLCPAGFHVPSDGDWTVLENALGGSSVAGTALKAALPAWDGTNSSGFSALPGGLRNDDYGSFGDQGYYGGWWSSSPYGPTAWLRSLGSGSSSVFRSAASTRAGFSVRCVRNSETEACLDPDGDGVCAENEVSGCTDSAASNFNPAATESDESCEYPSPAQCGGATTVTFDGHTYALVTIGTQCWFAENLRSDTYRNGDAIPGNLSDAQWTSTSSGAQTVYGEGCSAVDAGSSDEVANLATYGRLYNWYAVNDSRGLCPSGYHVPSDAEWMTLEMALGMTSSQANSTGSRGTDQGAQMKTSSWGGTNSSGFSALPGGYRDLGDGHFNYQGDDGLWWSSSPYGSYAWYRDLYSGSSDVFRSSDGTRYGFSVRCVRDSETEACLDSDGDGVCAENEVSGCTDSTASNFNPAATESDESCEYPSPAQCGGASTVTFDGHTYALVAISTQCWFAENLRSDNYRNGDAIPGDLNNSQWTSTGSGAQAVYNNDAGSLATYGRLYNWYAVNDSRGLCPSGFHVPSDGEWTVLENALGGSGVAGFALKAASPAWNGTNSSGFSALPGGDRYSDNGFFYDQGHYGFWWSSSPDGADAWSRRLVSENESVYRDASYDSRNGFSVRCVRD